ncbi:MAG: cytidylyltransferase domain-containing protein [Carboxydocellales bacterium]
MSKVVCIVQARTGSTRLPGKVLRIVKGKSLLEHLVDRLQQCKKINQIVLATTDKESDQAIVDIAQKLGVGWFQGSEEDVLSRYLGAAQAYEADIIVRVTSDCPLIDPETIDQVVDLYIKSNVDYASNTIERTYPRGLDTEAFSLEALYKADALAGVGPYREHVTLIMYRHPETFTLTNLTAPAGLSRSDLRLCVDTQEDFDLIAAIYGKLYREGMIINIRDVIALLDSKPELAQINAHVEQKHV